jgi:hypothetical protein
MGDMICVNVYDALTMSTVLLEPPNQKNHDHSLVYQMANHVPSSQTLLGVWYAVGHQQVWHRFELLHGGLVLLQLKSGVTVSGKIEFMDEKCTVLLFLHNDHEPVQITGSWCLWRGALDFYFLGEYLLFSQD